MKWRIAIVASHPIQYHAHWYRQLALSEQLEVEVLYCHRATQEDQAQAGFGVAFDWDLPLLEGYRHRFLENVSARPGVTEFAGTDSPQLRGLIIQERYDAVVVSGWHTKGLCQAIRACWQSGTPVMVRGDSHLHDERSLLKRTVKWLPYRYFIPRFDACLAAGAWSRDYFLHYGAQPEKVFIVPHAAPEPTGPSDPAGTSEIHDSRRRWGVPEGSSVFLFAGKFIALKRPLDFIRALAQARAAGARVYGLMAGDGPMRSEIETLIASLNAPVSLLGFLNQPAMSGAYRTSDALVLASDRETWGMVVNEAMTCGRACIVTDRVGCGPDLIQPGRTGFIFPVGDVEALSARIRQIADSPILAATMGVAARDLITRHSVRAAAEGLTRAITAIAEDR